MHTEHTNTHMTHACTYMYAKHITGMHRGMRAIYMKPRTYMNTHIHTASTDKCRHMYVLI